jgi:glyoxylase I family protein
MARDETSGIRGVSHISLSVADLDRSLDFYRDVLGLSVFMEPFDAVAFDGREAMLLAGRLVIVLQAHRSHDGERFDPTRTGLDHLAFHVADRDELDSWATKLDRLGVAHSQTKDAGGLGWMIELRDPDGVQLELFATR